MKYSSSVDLAVPPESVHPYVSDLARYPQWMALVHSAESCGDHVWNVELRAKVGVFARSKRLRMRRTMDDGTVVVFERDENDGRNHAPWVMRVTLVPTAAGTLGEARPTRQHQTDTSQHTGAGMGVSG